MGQSKLSRRGMLLNRLPLAITKSFKWPMLIQQLKSINGAFSGIEIVPNLEVFRGTKVVVGTMKVLTDKIGKFS